jgi:hypothetical protein
VTADVQILRSTGGTIDKSIPGEVMNYQHRGRFAETSSDPFMLVIQRVNPKRGPGSGTASTVSGIA